jgi:hypothetical protein
MNLHMRKLSIQIKQSKAAALLETVLSTSHVDAERQEDSQGGITMDGKTC